MSDLEPRLTRNWGDPGAARVDGYVAAGGYEGLRRALTMAPGDIIETVKASGLRGRGGAGFPTGMKWGFVPTDTGKPTYVVVNFDESEPGTCNNRELAEREPHRLLEGTAIAALAIGCTTAFIYVRGEYLWQSIVLERAVGEAYAEGYLGSDVLGSGTRIDVVLHRGAGAYICGEETALLNSLEGLRGQPRLRPPFPAVEGLYASPTVINNVETLMNVPDIVVRGADWFRSVGTEKSPGTKMVTISGKVERPGNYEIALGMPFREVLDDLAGGVLDGRALKAWTPGGLLHADAHRRARGCGDRLRVAGGRGLDARHRRDHGDGRDRLRGGLRHPDGRVLRPRVLREVHALPRGVVVGHAGAGAGRTGARARGRPPADGGDGHEHPVPGVLRAGRRHGVGDRTRRCSTSARSSRSTCGWGVARCSASTRRCRREPRGGDAHDRRQGGLRARRHADHPGRRTRRRADPAVLRPPVPGARGRVPSVLRAGRGPAEARDVVHRAGGAGDGRAHAGDARGRRGRAAGQHRVPAPEPPARLPDL